MGAPQIQFINRRANFGKVPVNASTTRTFYLSNHGTVHSYFQVLDSVPIPGMIVTPRFGVVPVGGTASLKVEVNPNDVIKFDARVLVQIRGSKRLELRLGGESEEPYVDINVVRDLNYFWDYLSFYKTRFFLNSQNLILVEFILELLAVYRLILLTRFVFEEEKNMFYKTFTKL